MSFYIWWTDMVLRQLPARKIAPNRKSKPNPNPNPNPNWRPIFVGGNSPDTDWYITKGRSEILKKQHFTITISSGYISFTIHTKMLVIILVFMINFSKY